MVTVDPGRPAQETAGQLVCLEKERAEDRVGRPAAETLIQAVPLLFFF